ncbi:hypothetical protein NHX12_012855 [Muraenolepis orangiensis]|uniref:Uncharacterized protein n=1 Tax=Muraenolepis orangiensis TaxID=630683 RepID=A0A9Q0DGY7_9TELE|nr:hypothetical protein NHX12_012855 [Muraenolepis orangiensis]
MAASVDLNMAFAQQQPSPAGSPGPTLAAMGALPAHMLGTPYGAVPLSGLLGVKSVPFLALSSPAPAAMAVAPSHNPLAAYTAKISSAAAGMKKPERQKFSPY